MLSVISKITNPSHKIYQIILPAVPIAALTANLARTEKAMKCTLGPIDDMMITDFSRQYHGTGYKFIALDSNE